jgi:pimeloyl-ACP methyl ester carboxylesterase
LNQYQAFLSNPVNFVDPDGLVVIFVHGTYSDDSAFDAGVQAGFANTFSDRNVMSFKWSGKNRASAREAGAYLLAGAIAKARRMNPGQAITVVAHSHGGNVALEATKLGAKIDNLVTLGTPSRYDHEECSGNIGTWYNIYSEADGVQSRGGGAFRPLGQEIGPAGRWFPGAINLEASIDYGPIETHSRLVGPVSYRLIRNYR